MYRDLRCSICGEYVQRGYAEDPNNPHVRIECGTWDGLIGELQRLHNLNPDGMENALRHLIRVTDKGPFIITEVPPEASGNDR